MRKDSSTGKVEKYWQIYNDKTMNHKYNNLIINIIPYLYNLEVVKNYNVFILFFYNFTLSILSV